MMIEKTLADEKVEHGWLRTWLAFEVLAAKKERAKEALEMLIDKMDKDKKAKIYSKQFSELRTVENPMKNVKEAFSMTCEIELIAPNFDNLLQVVLEYGPSAIEIIEPSELKMKISEAQGVLNSVSQMMHKFAAAGVGGIVIAGGKE